MSHRESTEQGRSGRRGSEAAREEGAGQQPRQGSQRVETARGNDEPTHHFAPGKAPSEQGEDEHPGAEKIAGRQQGLAGGGTGRSGSKGAQTDRTEEAAQSGSPSGEHARHGRQHDPGKGTSS